MEFLRELLGEELYSQFETAINEHNEKAENKDKQVKLADLGTGDYVSKSKYTDLETEVSNLNESIKTHEETIETLKAGNKDNEELQKTIETHEGTIKTLKADYDTKIKGMRIQSAIRGKLTDTKYPDLLETKFDKDKITVAEDGTVLGIDEQLTTIKEQYKDLFIPSVTGRDPKNPGNPGKDVVTKEQFDKMGYLERVKLKQDNTELYNKLKE